MANHKNEVKILEQAAKGLVCQDMVPETIANFLEILQSFWKYGQAPGNVTVSSWKYLKVLEKKHTKVRDIPRSSRHIAKFVEMSQGSWKCQKNFWKCHKLPDNSQSSWKYRYRVLHSINTRIAKHKKAVKITEQATKGQVYRCKAPGKILNKKKILMFLGLDLLFLKDQKARKLYEAVKSTSQLIHMIIRN